MNLNTVDISKLPADVRKQFKQLQVLHAEKKIQNKAKDDFLSFVKCVWPDFVEGSHHRHISEKFNKLATGEINRLIINMPPRHTKSEFASYLLPAWMVGREPRLKIIQATHTGELAIRFGRKAKNLIDSEDYSKIFKTTLQEDSKAAGRWETAQGGEYFAAGVGGAITGRGADLLIIDDPHSEQDALSPTAMESAYEWYTSGPRQRLQPGGKIVLVMTRWSNKDLTGKLLQNQKEAKADQWHVVEFPAIMDHGTSEAAPVWPEYWKLDELEKVQATLPTGKWNAQWMQNPTAEEGAILKREWWRIWPNDWIPTLHHVIQSYDTAFLKKETADYSAITTWGVFYPSEDEPANLMLLDAVKGRYEFPELRRLALEQYKYWQPESVIIEAKASGLPLTYELRNMDIPVVNFTPSKGNDKHARVNSVAPLFESGMIWCPEQKFADDVMEECAAFPYGDHDDLVDSTTQAIMRFRQGGLIQHPEDYIDEQVNKTKKELLLMINKIIRNFIAKQMAGRSDDGIMITLKDPQKVTLAENIMADLLIRNGIDPRIIKSEDELKMILQQIENARIREIQNTGIRNTESAKVFDLEGKEIPKGSKIMGGKAIDDDLPPPGSRGGKDDIAAPVQSSEESLKNMIEAENKKGIAKIKQRQKMLDDAIEDASPGFANDIKYDAELVAENLAERMGLVYDDLPTKQRLDIYDKAYTGLSKKRFQQRQSLEDFVDDAGGVDESDPRGIDDFIPDPEDMAKGGRVGFFKGAVAGGENISPGTDTKGNVRDDNPFTGGGGDGPKGPPSVINPPKTNPIVEKLKSANTSKLSPFQKFMMHNKFVDQLKARRGKNYHELGGLDFMARFPDINPDVAKGLASAYQNIFEIGRAVADGPGGKTIGDALDTAKEEARLNAVGIDAFANPDSSLYQEYTGMVPESGAVQMADGGRIGFKDGMNRRTFLKLLGGAMSIPIIGKIFKPLKVGKTVTKVPIIKTDNVAGKPEWFDQLVNKVILEGDDVTKRFATGERQSIHQKTLDDGSVVRVTEDVDDGAVRVEYESDANVYEDPVQLRYKKPLPDEGDPRPSAEFDVAESGPVGRADGPDDYSIDIDEVGGTSISDLTSDVSKLKEYATGQKPTLKEFVQSKKRKDKARRITEGGEAEMDAVIERQGEFIENDLVDLDPGDFAKGGIARMLGE